jgi:hypothetical protein
MKITSFIINNNNIPLHIGEPHQDASSPLEFQAKYFAKNYNLNLPPEIFESFNSFNEVAKALKIPLPILINYVLNKISQKNDLKKMFQNQCEIAKNIRKKPIPLQSKQISNEK